MLNCLIINLAHREDRRIHIGNELKKFNFNYYLLDAIADGSGTCFQSQKKCIETAKENGWNEVLILEDDAIFSENASDIFFKAKSELPEDWDMFFMGANLKNEAKKYSPHLHRMYGAFAAHAYMVNSKFYDTILSLPFTKEMDIHYRELMPHSNVYLCSPMIAYQIQSFSDLQGRVRDYTDEMNDNYNQFAEK